MTFSVRGLSVLCPKRLDCAKRTALQAGLPSRDLVIALGNNTQDEEKTMILTTTPIVERMPVVECKALVSATGIAVVVKPA
jgi:hypothetical protein